MGTHYSHLSLAERVQIEKLVDSGVSLNQIARRLGRAPSTISREIRQRSWRPSNTAAAYTPYGPHLKFGDKTKRQYRSVIAQADADRNSARSHQIVKMKNDRLVAWVCDHLRKGWTPQEMAGRLSLLFPDDPAMRVNHETIYAWIYRPDQKVHARWQYLTRGQKRRRKRGGRGAHHQRINYRVPIAERPSVVDDRSEFGHWEADSILGLRGTGAIHTEVERTSRMVMARKITGTTADETLRVQFEIFVKLPPHSVKSITADNGSEFAYHYKFADQTGIPTYFADPYSSWQRGTNEHFNGRIRKYLPKGTNFSELTDEELQDYVNEINNRPRKILGWRTPAEVFTELCST